MNYSETINGRTLEFFDEGHIYLVDGIEVPSITQMLKWRFANKYAGVSERVLKEAADRGTEVHEAIEAWCRNGTETDLPEVRNFRFLQSAYQFEVIGNEVPVILSKDDTPIAAGRLDLVLRMNGKTGLGDIKRTYQLDKAYLMVQLNLYRIAYMQTYGKRVDFLRGIHLREDVRKFVSLPISESDSWAYINDYLEAHK